MRDDVAGSFHHLISEVLERAPLDWPYWCRAMVGLCAELDRCLWVEASEADIAELRQAGPEAAFGFLAGKERDLLARRAASASMPLATDRDVATFVAGGTFSHLADPEARELLADRIEVAWRRSAGSDAAGFGTVIS